VDLFCYLSDRSSDIARKKHVDASDLKSSAIELKYRAVILKLEDAGIVRLHFVTLAIRKINHYTCTCTFL